MKRLIIILGHTNDLNGNLSPLAKARLDKALDLLSEFPESKVLLTGGWGDNFNQTNKPHASYSKIYLLDKGVNEALCMDFILSSNTVEDAEESRAVVSLYDPSEIFLISSDIHISRAEYIFHQNFPNRKITSISAISPLPVEELKPLIEHEIKQLKRLKESYHGGR